MPHVVGLGLGQMGDYTALAVVRYADGEPRRFEVPTLHRWPLSTPYLNIAADLARFLRPRAYELAEVAVDSTGVGAAVTEMIVNALEDAAVPVLPLRVTITAGAAVTEVVDRPRTWHVAKRQLVSALSAVIHSGRLQVAVDQPEAAVLVGELREFKIKVNVATGNESFESWRSRAHDDLVLAVALAVWAAERARPKAGSMWGPGINTPGETPYQQAVARARSDFERRRQQFAEEQEAARNYDGRNEGLREIMWGLGRGPDPY